MSRMDLFTIGCGAAGVLFLLWLFRGKKKGPVVNDSTGPAGSPALPLDVQPWEREMLERMEARIAFNKRVERARGLLEGPRGGVGGDEDEEMGPPPGVN